MNIEYLYYLRSFPSFTDWYHSTTNGVLNSIVTAFNASDFENKMLRKISSLFTISLRCITIHFQERKLANFSIFSDFTQICYALYYAMLFSVAYNDKPGGKSNHITLHKIKISKNICCFLIWKSRNSLLWVYQDQYYSPQAPVASKSESFFYRGSVL